MMMLRGAKRTRRWAAWLLPGFLLRSLVPVGFMPMVGPGHSVQLVVCESYAPLPSSLESMPMVAGMDMSRHHHAAVAAHSGGGPPFHQDHGNCPYGSGPALGALPSLALLPISIDRPPELPVALPQVGYFKLPPRAQSPRGPPARFQDS